MSGSASRLITKDGLQVTTPDLRAQHAAVNSQCGRQGGAEEPLDWARNLWHTSFMGVQTIQFHVDMLVWERVLNARRDLRSIIELGSGAGGLSLFLALQAYQREMRFATFDKWQTDAAQTRLGKLLDMLPNCYAGDLFAGGAQGAINELPHPMILLCDNGEKPREFRTFAPLLQTNDLIAVHDFGNEYTLLDVKPVEGIVQPFFWQECEAMGSLTRFWRRV